MRILVAVMLAIALMAGAVQAQTVEAPVQKNYTGTEIRAGSFGPLVIIAWPYEIDGKLAVCGFHFSPIPGSKDRRSRNSILRTMVVDLNGKILSANPTDFTAYADEAAATRTRMGKCSVTGNVWSPDYATTKLRIYGRRNFIRE